MFTAEQRKLRSYAANYIEAALTRTDESTYAFTSGVLHGLSHFSALRPGQLERIVKNLWEVRNFKLYGYPKAFLCSMPGFSEVYVAASTRSKARYIYYKIYRKAGYKQADFVFINVKRAKKYDGWAKTASQKVVHLPNTLP